MTLLQRLRLRKVEVTRRLGELAASEEALTDEEHDELRSLATESADLEARIVAAELSETRDAGQHPEGGETSEVDELRNRASLARYLTAAVSGHDVAPGSAEEELRAAVGATASTDGILVPWAALAPEEVRADAPTGTSVSDGPVEQLPWIRRVFRTAVTEALGITMVSVPAGRRETTVITGGVAPAAKAENASAPDAVALTVSEHTLTPRRLTGRYVLTEELLAAVGTMAERYLQDDLTDAMADLAEAQMLVGDGTAPNVQGIATAITDAAVPDAVTTFGVASALASQLVDGRYANVAGDVTLVTPVDGYRFAYSLYTNAGDVSAGRNLAAEARTFLSSGHLPDAPTSGARDKVSTGYAHLGMRDGDAYAAYWGGGLVMIRDPYTQAAEGQVILTARTLWDFRVTRPAAWGSVAIKTG